MTEGEYCPEYEEETIDALVPKLFKRSDVTHLLGISERSLRKLIREGELRVIKIGSTERFRPCDIRRLIDRM